MPGYAALMTVTQEQFGSVKEDIRILSTMVLDVQDAVNGHTVRLNKIDARLDKMDGRLNKMDGRLDGIDSRLDGIDGRLDGIDGRLDGIDGRLDGLHSSVIEILTLVRRDSAGGQAAGSVDVGAAG